MGMKIDLFQSSSHCWVFQICWHIECSTFTASSFRIWNTSTIPSHPPALFIVTLPKAHLTSYSKMSGSRWVITLLWLCESLRFFLYSSSASQVAQWYRICLQYGRSGLAPWVGTIPWRRERLPTPVFWPGEFHGLHTVHGVTKSQTQLSNFYFQFSLSVYSCHLFLISFASVRSIPFLSFILLCPALFRRYYSTHWFQFFQS